MAISASPENQFAIIPSTGILGMFFGSFGYVCEDIVTRETTPRAIVGSVQWFYTYRGSRYLYHAVELSVPIPNGVSGAPIFLHDDPNHVFAVATGAKESFITVDHIITITEEIPGHTRVEKMNKIISYGVGVLLTPLEEWIVAALAQ